MTAEKPVPCPVCGLRPKVIDVGYIGAAEAIVRCAHEGARRHHVVSMSAQTRAAAIATWNRAYGRKLNTGDKP